MLTRSQAKLIAHLLKDGNYKQIVGYHYVPDSICYTNYINLIDHNSVIITRVITHIENKPQILIPVFIHDYLDNTTYDPVSTLLIFKEIQKLNE